ncbi:hypothetical protein ACWDZW_24635, partial [Streptomyces coeruleorubidus]
MAATAAASPRSTTTRGRGRLRRPDDDPTPLRCPGRPPVARGPTGSPLTDGSTAAPGPSACGPGGPNDYV